MTSIHTLTAAEVQMLRYALERAITYIEFTVNEEGGEEAAEAAHDLRECRAALAALGDGS